MVILGQFNVRSEKDKYLDFYFDLTRKMEQMAEDLPYLRLSSHEEELLADANLEQIMQSTTFHIPIAYDNDPAILLDEKKNIMQVIQDRSRDIKIGISLSGEKNCNFSEKIAQFALI